jgi:hypothetical protein
MAAPLDPRLQKYSYLLLGAGGLVFIVGLYLGFDRHASPGWVYSLLVTATLAFAVVIVMLRMPGLGAFFGAAADSAPQAQMPAAQAQAPVAQAQTPAGQGAAELPSKEAPPQTELAKLLDTTLGGVLLEALRSDPEGAKRLLARAIALGGPASSGPG